MINRQIAYFAIRCKGSLIRQHKGFFDVISFILHEGIEGTVNGVVFAGFDFDGDDRQAVVVINEIVHLSLMTIIVIKEFMPMCRKFACHNIFVN